MAVSNPVYFKNGGIRKASTNTVVSHIDFGLWLWGEGSGRSVDLSYKLAGNGSLQSLIDYRDVAGDLGTESNATNNTSFGNNNPDAVIDAGAATTYDYLDETVATVTLSTSDFPLKINSNGDLQVMTYQDVLDTYIDDIVDAIVSSSNKGGTYNVRSTSLSGWTQIGNSTDYIFQDKRFNQTSFDLVAGQTATREWLPLSSVDQPLTITTYRLYREDAATEPSFTMPLYYNKANDSIQVYTYTKFKNFLSNVIKYAAANEAGYKVRYDWQNFASGTHRHNITPLYSTFVKRNVRATVTDTTLNGSARVNDQDNDNYRSVNIPAGSAENESVYSFTIKRI
jgi:hypothetical protein